MTLIPDVLGIDTNCFVYYLEARDSDRALFLTDEVFGPMAEGRRRAIASWLTVAELMVPVARLPDPFAFERARFGFLSMPGLEVLPINSSVALAAARYGPRPA